MKTYKVIFEMELGAESPLDAALTLENWMAALDYRPELKVIDSEGNKTIIDLEELETEEE